METKKYHDIDTGAGTPGMLAKMMSERPPDPPEKLVFKLPEGYSLGFRISSSWADHRTDSKSQYILRDPDQVEIAVFNAPAEQDHSPLNILNPYVHSRIEGGNETSPKGYMVLSDESRKVVTQIELNQTVAQNPLQQMLIDLMKF